MSNVSSLEAYNESRQDRVPQEYVEWAFELWAFEYSQNMQAVQRRISMPTVDDPLPARDISYNTIRNWAKRDEWPAELTRRMRQLAPDMHSQTLANLTQASVGFSRYLNQLANDKIPLTDAIKIGAAKTMIEGAKVSFDRTGIMPWLLTKERGKPPAPTPEQEKAIGTMSLEQLQEAVDRRLTITDTRIAETVTSDE